MSDILKHVWWYPHGCISYKDQVWLHKWFKPKTCKFHIVTLTSCSWPKSKHKQKCKPKKCIETKHTFASVRKCKKMVPSTIYKLRSFGPFIRFLLKLKSFWQCLPSIPTNFLFCFCWLITTPCFDFDLILFILFILGW